jgi:hypothetical protein
MTQLRRLLPALVLATVFAAGQPALAAEPEAVATAPPAAAPAAGAPTAAAASVADQIDNYLKTSPAAELRKDDATGVTPGSEPRKIHGMVDVTVGTGGYRSAYVRSDVPIGATGTASFAFGETHFGNQFGGRFGSQFGGRFAPGVSQSFGLGLRFDDAALDPADCRRRQAIGEDGPGLRYDPRIEGERLRPCPAAGAPTSPQ